MPVNSSPASASRQSEPAATHAEQWIQHRAGALFEEKSKQIWRLADNRFFWLFLLQWVGVVSASILLPESWHGLHGDTSTHLWIPTIVGGVIIAVPLVLTSLLPSKTATRHVVAISQMLFGALLIHLTAGRSEAYFHIFGSLAFLALYRDRKVIATGTIVVLIDQAASAYLLPGSISGGIGPDLLRALEYGGWVIFEDIALLMSITLSWAEIRLQGENQARVESLMTMAISESKQEEEMIMATIDQGLFLLNPNFRIGTSYSKALEQVLASSDLANKDFLHLLRRLVPEALFATVKDYLGLMFDPKKREKPLAKLNPLNQVEVTVASPDGGTVSKHLAFNFTRVMRKGKVSYLLVGVTDATDRVLLEQRLKETEEGKEKQFDLLMGVIHVEPAALQEFIAATEQALDSANSALKEENVTQGQSAVALRKKLEYVFRKIHTIKGNASLLQLEYFENRAHDIEDKVTELQGRPTLAGEDFAQIGLALADLHSDLAAIETLVARLVNLHRTFPVRHGAPQVDGVNGVSGLNGHQQDQVLESVSNLVDTLSLKLGKEAVFVCDQFEGEVVPPKYHGLFKDVVVQLARNSLVHGIEAPEERVSVSKRPGGCIKLFSLTGQDDENFEFVFRDDGRGLNSQNLASKAVALGMASSEEVGAWDSSQLISLIFEPGFSTAHSTTPEAGRGVGMDIVKTRVVDECGGEIRVNSTPGQFCEFHIILPNG